MSVLIIGGKGNMGRRYGSILKFLGRPYLSADVEEEPSEILGMAKKATGIIIATPTDTHTAYLLSLSKLRKPILCEKPICKDTRELSSVLAQVHSDRCALQMVLQYAMLANANSRGTSYYNYYRHGSDGLAWDCIQILGLARGPVKLEETSPIWTCTINGQKLDVAGMDAAYVSFIRRWLSGDKMHDPSWLMSIHEKSASYHLEMKKNGGLH